jgi:hypothetical protein
MSGLVRIAVLLFALALAGCTVVRVQASGKGEVEVRQGVGIVSIQILPGAGAVVVDSTSFGAINGPEGFTLGYHSATTAAIKRDGCHLVVWIHTGEQLKELKELLQDRTDVCAVRPQYTKREMP